MVEERWLFVWDFDRTLTRAHTVGQEPLARLAEAYVRSNLVDEELFRTVVGTVQTDRQRCARMRCVRSCCCLGLRKDRDLC